MIDPEFHLVRLTPQSKRADPKHVPGGVPAWTAADVQALAGSIRDIFAYWAILAKFCQSDIATANLTDAMQRLPWQSWRDKPLNRDIAFSDTLLSYLSGVNSAGRTGNYLYTATGSGNVSILALDSLPDRIYEINTYSPANPVKHIEIKRHCGIFH